MPTQVFQCDICQRSFKTQEAACKCEDFHPTMMKTTGYQWPIGDKVPKQVDIVFRKRDGTEIIMVYLLDSREI